MVRADTGYCGWQLLTCAGRRKKGVKEAQWELRYAMLRCFEKLRYEDFKDVSRDVSLPSSSHTPSLLPFNCFKVAKGGLGKLGQEDAMGRHISARLLPFAYEQTMTLPGGNWESGIIKRGHLGG